MGASTVREQGRSEVNSGAAAPDNGAIPVPQPLVMPWADFGDIAKHSELPDSAVAAAPATNTPKRTAAPGDFVSENLEPEGKRHADGPGPAEGAGGPVVLTSTAPREGEKVVDLSVRRQKSGPDGLAVPKPTC